MPYQPVAQTAQVTIEGRMDGQLTILDLYFQNSGAVTQLNLGNIASAVSNWIQLQLAPLLSNDWTSLRVKAVDLDTQTGPVSEAPAVFAGGVTSEAAPNNVAACVSFRTAQRGRSGRGRNFVPGIPNSVITLNTMTSIFIGDLVAAYSQLVGPGTFSAGWQWCVVSRFENNVKRAAGLVIPITSAIMVGNSVRSMRSREIGHGA